MGGGNRGRVEGYICGVLTLSADFIGLSGGGVPVEVPHAGHAMVKFYLKAMEVPSVYPAGGSTPPFCSDQTVACKCMQKR